MLANAAYQNRDEDLRYRRMRSGADYENRDEDARFRNSYSMASREESDRQRAHDQMYREAQREDAEWNARYDNMRRMADYENADMDRRMRGSRPPMHGILTGMGQFIEGFGEIGAYKSALGEQQSLFLGAQAFGVDPTSAEGGDVMALLRRSARGAAVGTSFSEGQTAAGIPLLARPFGLDGMQGARDFSNVYAPAARAAEAIDMMRLGSFDDTLQSAIEYAHQTRTYDPAGFQQQMDVLGAITAMTPHTTFGAEARTMSYIVPLARTAGIDPTEAAIATGFLQQGGLRGTVAGTTLRQMLVGLTRTGGPMNAQHSHLASMSAALEHGLHMTPEAAHAVHGGAGSAHARALRDVGYVDAQGNPTFLTDNGSIDLEKVFSTFGAYANTHTPFQTETEAYNLFGVRGQQGAELISSAQENYARYQGRVRGMIDTPGGYLGTARDQLSQSGWQEFGQAWKRVVDIGNHLADSTLPGLQNVLEYGVIPAFNALAGLTAPDASGHYSAGQQAAGYTVGGAVAAGSIWGLRALGSRIFGGAAAGAAGEAVGGVIGSIAAMTVGSISVGSLLLGAAGVAAIGAAIYAAWHGLADPSHATGADPHDHMMPWGMDQGHTLGKTVQPAVGSRAAAGLQGYGALPRASQSEGFALRKLQESYAPMPNVSITIPGITLNGVGSDIEKMVRGLFEELSKKLAQTLTHSTGQGAGTNMSPWLGYP
jgi:hypothetical protein